MSPCLIKHIKQIKHSIILDIGTNGSIQLQASVALFPGRASGTNWLGHGVGPMVSVDNEKSRTFKQVRSHYFI
jgi:hypothetical protein